VTVDPLYRLACAAIGAGLGGWAWGFPARAIGHRLCRIYAVRYARAFLQTA
jgi:hypothetical protein